MMKLIRKHHKKIAVLLVITFIQSFVEIPKSFALTGGNTMPEYRSFEPVSTSNMVNLFDGSFTYNLPLLDVPNGYPINLSYHSSAINTEADAGWVGLGFSLNPGAINRIKRGFPDEFNGEAVQYYNKTKPNVTVDFMYHKQKEIFGAEVNVNKFLPSGVKLGGSPNSLRFVYNTATGFSKASRFGNLSVNLLDLPIIKDVKNQVQGFTSKINFAKYSQLKIELGERTSKTKKRKKFETENLEVDVYSKSSFSSTTSVGYSFSASQPSSFSMNASEYTGESMAFQYDFGSNSTEVPAEMKEKSVYGNVISKSTISPAPKKVYGYMFSENAKAEDESIMDYSTEMDDVYKLKQRFLGIPVPNHDLFSVSGQGIGGTIRPFRTEIGNYRKNKVKSITTSVGTSLDASFPKGGSLTSVGLEISGEYAEVKMGAWNHGGNSLADNMVGDDKKLDTYTFHGHDDASFDKTNEKFVLRYVGDMSSSFNQAASDKAIRAELNPVTGLTAGLRISNENGKQKRVLTSRVPRSTYVSAKTNAVSLNNRVDGIAYKNYQKDLYIKTIDDNIEKHQREDYTLHSLGEMTSIGANGMRYVYGLPLYNRNERSITYDLHTKNGSNELFTYNEATDLIAAPKTNADIDGHSKVKIGYHNPHEYSNQFLLTEIVSPDYIDITNNGPSADDFGSYTKFNYKRFAGGKDEGDEWYTYKMPYNGATINWGSQSTSKDDMASFSSGEKELYYMESVVSKTHVAFFKTSDREDGLSATASLNENGLLHNDGLNAEKSKLQKLDKIELYAIQDCDDLGHGYYEPKSDALPIKTVRFSYAYELCPGTPNSSASNGAKLTLKKVWFEYQGKKTHKVSPYEFEYQYPQGLTYPERYSGVNNPFNSLFTETAQNPTYNVLNSDRWGAYRDFSDLQNNIGPLARNFPYVNQAPASSFDPAAWCLKQIKLPSGGQILIQYEQNDYQYVQNQRADVMVPLSTETNKSEVTADYTSKKYYLDLAKIGVDISELNSLEKKELIQDLFQKQKAKKERMYFSFYYKLMGLKEPTYNCRSADYVDGYARVRGYGFDDKGVYFTFNGVKSEQNFTDKYYKKITYNKWQSKFELPRRVCKDFFENQRVGLLNPNNCKEDDLEEENTASTISTVLSKLAQLSGLSQANCLVMSPQYSFVRLQVPITKKKLGGGVRVKRLLSYASGISTATGAVLYGNEYTYERKLNPNDKNSPVISSGVATNEPGIGRNENALVKPLNSKPKNLLGVNGTVGILFGPEMYSEEGPLGESLMPSASIGYEQVKVNSIYKGVTSTGYALHQYHTCRKFPFKAEHTNIRKKINFPVAVGQAFQKYKSKVYTEYENDEVNKSSNVTETTVSNQTSIGINTLIYRPHLTQGYSFISNAMHGQPKSSATYANAAKEDEPTTLESYEYFEFDEKVDMMDENHHITSEDMWRESEVLGESRKVKNTAYKGEFGVDVSLTPATIPYIYVTGSSVNFTYVENTIKSHVTTKIINYPAVVKKVTSMSDGIVHVSENKVFDKFTGQPVIVETYDDFNKAYTSVDFKAAWHTKNLRGKYINEGLLLEGATYTSISNDDYFVLDNCHDLGFLIEGDFIELSPASSSCSGKHLFHIKEINQENKRVYVIPSQLNNCNDIASGTYINSIEIIRSGYTNELNLSDGGIVTHDNRMKGSELVTDENSITTKDPFISDLNTGLDNYFLYNNLPDTGVFALPGEYNNLQIFNPCSINGEALCDEKIYLQDIKIQVILNHTNSTFDLSIIDGNIRTYTGQGETIKSSSYTDQPICENSRCGISIGFNNSLINTNIGIKLSDGPFTSSVGYFQSKILSGDIEFKLSDCDTILPTTCFKLCSDNTGPGILNQVISASAATFSDYWPYDENYYPQVTSEMNLYEKGEKGRWRVSEQFTYREDINREYNHNSGVFTLELFNWKTPSLNNENWVKTTTVTKYSPNGEAIEDENILGIKSTSKYGYHRTLPVLVAQNAADHSVAFESFERLYQNGLFFEDGVPYQSSAGSIDTKVAHTGEQSIRLQQADFQVARLNVTDQISTEGLMIRAWFRHSVNPDALEGVLKAKIGAETVTFQRVSGAGEWQLYEAELKNLPISSSENVYIKSTFVGAGDIHVDDVRVQPMDAEMVTYVYDHVQRLIAVMDDQHYAMLYQYDIEGSLVRKLKETVKGIKTISDKQYNIIGIDRTDAEANFLQED